MGQAEGTLKAADEALQGLREGMEADGYLLHVEALDGGTLSVRVEATPDACEECLVQKALMSEIIKASLPDSLGVSAVALTYPVDSAH